MLSSLDSSPRCSRPASSTSGWLKQDTQLVSVGSEFFEPKNLDEYRVPYNSREYDWSAKYK